MDELALLIVLRTLKPAISAEIYSLAERWESQTPQHQQLSQLSEQTEDSLNIAQ